MAGQTVQVGSFVGHLADRIAAVPYALLQQQLFMTLEPVPNVVIEEIVDTIFLPLVQGPAKRS